MGKYRVLVLAGPAFMFSIDVAPATESNHLSYYCTTDATGGVWYDARTKKWEATRFKPDDKFVLKLQYVRSYTDKGQYWENNITDYVVTVTNAGTKYAAPCSYSYFYAHTDGNAVPMMNNYLRCNASLIDYDFNLENNRFLSTYLQGYVDGKDSNENTPAVSAGTCTKIE